MSQHRSMRTARHFDALDGLRGVAALTVLLGHASAMMLGNDDTFVFRKKLAVVFFFMLSGFVVTSAYDSRFRRGYPVGAFLVRRAIRLFPMIVAGAVLSTLACALFEPAWHESWRGPAASLAALLCLPAPHTDFDWWTRFPVDPPEWSLFFEIGCYLAFAFVLARLPAAPLLGLVAIAATVCTATDLHRFPADMPFALLGVGAIGAFTIGLLLFRLHDAGHLPDIPAPFPLLALAIVAICVVPARFGPWPNAFALLVAFPLLIASGAARGRGDATRAERLLGDLSFPLYIVHWPFLVAAHRLVAPRLGAPAAIACGIAAAIAAAALLLRFYDDGIRRTLLTLLARREAATSAPAIARRRSA